MILIFGRSGLLARALIDLATRRGAPATALGRAEADLTSPGAARRAIEALTPKAVINAAAATHVDGCEKAPGWAAQLNAEAPAEMAEVCATRDVPFLHVSTDYVFAGDKGAPYVESDAPSPINVYGATKLEGERRVRQAGGRALILRTSWVYGPQAECFPKFMLRLGATQSEARAAYDQINRPTPASALAEACFGAVARLRTQAPPKDRLCHFAGGDDLSRLAWVERTFSRARSLGHRLAPVIAASAAEFVTAARRPADTRMESARAEQWTGCAPPRWDRDLDAVIESALGEPGEGESRN